jgi:hypothetical protein
MKTTAIQPVAALMLVLTMGAAGLQLHAQSTETKR